MVISLSSAALTQAASPTTPWQSQSQAQLSLYMIIYNFDPNSLTINASFEGILQDYNFSGAAIILRIDSIPFSGESVFVTMSGGGNGYFQGFSNPVALPVVSHSTNFPFDSYELDLNVSNPMLGRSFPFVAWSYFAPRGPYLSLESLWVLNAPHVLNAHGVASETNNLLVLSLTRNPSQGAVEILPVVIGFALLGSVYFIRPEEFEKRLLVSTSLFVFAPVYLFAIEPLIPLHFSLSLFEWLLSILLIGVGIQSIESVIAAQLSHGRAVFADLMTLLAMEISFVYLETSQLTFSNPNVVLTFVLSLALFIVPGLLGIRLRKRKEPAGEKLTNG